MSSHLRWFAAVAWLLAICGPLFADAGLPCAFWTRRDRAWPQTPAANPEQDFKIVRDADAKQAELHIPRRMLAAETPERGSTRNAMVGLAISAAFVGGGLWCLRYREGQIPKKKILAIFAVLFLAIGGMSVGNFADATPARGMPAGAALVFKHVKLDEFDVTVRIVDHGEEIQLIVPPDIADKLVPR